MVCFKGEGLVGTATCPCVFALMYLGMKTSLYGEAKVRIFSGLLLCFGFLSVTTEYSSLWQQKHGASCHCLITLESHKDEIADSKVAAD